MGPEKLFDVAPVLPPEAPLEFASKLPAGVEDGPGQDWTQAWLQECDSHVAAANTGAEPPLPWKEAYGRLRARLAKR